MTIRIPLLFAAVSLVLVSCTNRPYTRYHSLPEQGWHCDSILCFDVPVRDTTDAYDLQLHIRHTDRYAYQNIWFFVQSDHRDTVEAMLADYRGQWLSAHSGRYYNGYVRLADSIYLHCDTLHVTVQHGMRDTVIYGISEIGIALIDHGKK